MAEAVGLALGVLGIPGLFIGCIENFDIVVKAKHFGEDFDCSARRFANSDTLGNY